MVEYIELMLFVCLCVIRCDAFSPVGVSITPSGFVVKFIHAMM